MASIVDGLVTWAKFLREFIDTYRWAIRDPLAYVGNAIWPFGTIPGWVFDVFLLWSALFLATNIFTYRTYRTTVLGIIRDNFRDEGFLSSMFGLLAYTIFLPLMLLGMYLGAFATSTEARQGVSAVLTNFVFIVALFMLILLINWQIRNLGG
jgi:hypothetical protein